MSAQEYDPFFSDAEPLSPQGRYFSDVFYKSDSYTDMQISIEKYVESANIGLSPEEAAELFKATLSGLEYDPSLPEGELRDIFTIAPYLVIGPALDQSKGIAEIREWYDNALSYLRTGMNPAHNKDCLDSPTFAYHSGCAHGRHCPLITVAKFLEQDLFDMDFSTEKYEGDALIRHQIGVEKERLAIKHKLRNEVNANSLIQMYHKNYAMYFMGPQ